jgi:EAL domain-containing protein (putative c-di-GMP-specific phosphodiesterase class I)
MTENSENAEIVRTIVTLARSLEMSVVAEGIEQMEQLDALRALDCDYGQGYLFSRPVGGRQAAALAAVNFNQMVSERASEDGVLAA